MHYKLTEEIIKLSNSKFWDEAKLEWHFTHAYKSEELQTCLCGHYPITNICVIKNSINKKETEVGNCCINKFLGITEGNKIFTAISRIKEDISKSMGADVLEYLNNKQVITEFEYDFYIDTLRKRKLSPKQLEIRQRINAKLIDFTSYESNSNFNKINRVLLWAENNKWFDTNFMISLKASCERKGKLTEGQSKALDSIIQKLRIK